MQISDRELLTSSLTAHKHQAEQYLSTADHSASPGFLQLLMDLCSQEQQSRLQVYHAMNQRGWYNPKSMDQQQMQQALQNFNQKRSELQQAVNSTVPSGSQGFQQQTQGISQPGQGYIYYGQPSPSTGWQ